MKLLAHLNGVHGAEAVNGMAGLMAWSQVPTRALGRFDAGHPPKRLDEMYGCATNEFEQSTITDLLFQSVTDMLDRYLPDNPTSIGTGRVSVAGPDLLIRKMSAKQRNTFGR